MKTNRQIVIDSLPAERLAESNFRMQEAPVPQPRPGEVLCRTLAIQIAAGSRAALQGSIGYRGAPRTGQVMWGEGVARVEASEHPDFAPADRVLARSGWQDYSVHAGETLIRIGPDEDPTHYLGALGTNGLTAYFGLREAGRPRKGETLLVSAAAGSVGHLVGQMARTYLGSEGRVIGVTGSEKKGALLTARLGFDATVNHRKDDFRDALKAACPDGVDVYFDNTGGPILEGALFRMNKRGRIVCCGVVSQYDTNSPAAGPRGVPGILINKRLHMTGILIFDYAARYREAREEIRAWLTAGQLKSWTDERRGLQEAPAALVDLLAGGNVGTRIVRVQE